MSRIPGAEQAVRALRPHWQALEEQFEIENRRFKELLMADHSMFGRIVKSHLISEIYIDRYLHKKLGLSRVADARLSYYQKVTLLPEHGTPVAIIKPGLLRLNQIRNKIAHNLDVDIAVDELRPMMDILELSGRDTDRMDSLSAIEAFTTLACTWLLVLPSHLEEVVVKAFRNIVVEVESE